MHVLWEKNNTQKFWLYVGQAVSLRERVQNHNDRQYRSRHPSLHYHVWGSVEDMESVFVTLAVGKIPTYQTEQLILNLQEMWMACIFQTLDSMYSALWSPPNRNILTLDDHHTGKTGGWRGLRFALIQGEMLAMCIGVANHMTVVPEVYHSDSIRSREVIIFVLETIAFLLNSHYFFECSLPAFLGNARTEEFGRSFNNGTDLRNLSCLILPPSFNAVSGPELVSIREDEDLFSVPV